MYDPNPIFRDNALYGFAHAGEQKLFDGNKATILARIREMDKRYEVEGLDGVTVNGAALGLMHVYHRIPEAEGEIYRMVSGGIKLPKVSRTW
jgi:hypothetical protein